MWGGTDFDDLWEYNPAVEAWTLLSSANSGGAVSWIEERDRLAIWGVECRSGILLDLQTGVFEALRANNALLAPPATYDLYPTTHGLVMYAGATDSQNDPNIHLLTLDDGS